MTLKKNTSLPFLFIILVWFRCVIEAQTGRAKSNKILLSPQPDKPVQDKEDEKAEEQHVAQQFGLTAPGQLLDSADGGTKQAARGVKVCVHIVQHCVLVFDFCANVNGETF